MKIDMIIVCCDFSPEKAVMKICLKLILYTQLLKLKMVSAQISFLRLTHTHYSKPGVYNRNISFCDLFNSDLNIDILNDIYTLSVVKNMKTVYA